jgi:PAS domain S-box-containing protein
MQRFKLLVLEGESHSIKGVEGALHAAGYAITSAYSPQIALELLRHEEFDLVLAELSTSPDTTAGFLRESREIDSDMVGIVITEPEQVDSVVNAMRDGVFDYMVKPLSLELILPTLSRAVAVRNLRLKNLYLQQAVAIYKLSIVKQLSLDPDTVLEKIADAGFELAQTSGFAILLVTEDGKSLRVAKTRGETAMGDEGDLIRITPVISRWVKLSKEPTGDLKTGASERPSRQLSILGMPQGRSVAMLAGDKFIGVLHFTTKNARRGVSVGQGKQFHILAGAAASAVEAAVMLEQLRSAERRYRGLAEEAADMVFRYEVYPAPCFTYVNPAAIAITGHSPADFYADPGLMLKIAHQDDYREMQRMLSGELPNGSTITLRCLRRDGGVGWLEQRISHVNDPTERLIAIEGIVRDITERQALEEQLRQSQKMEAIGLLAGGVAHDFNNLLTVVIGYSDLILADDLPPSRTVDKITQIKKAADQAVSLTRQLLAAGRPQQVRPLVLDLNKIVNSSSKILRRLIGEDVDLVTNLQAGLGCVKVDAGQIEQILMNLTVNARGAMPQGGKITVETKDVVVTDNHSSDSKTKHSAFVMLSVSDTGCGMDAATQARMFEPFFTTKESGKGTGLGLSIVYGIVRQSAGQIRVISEPGHGARFEILFPRVAEVAKEEPVTAPLVQDVLGGSETILVVEDDAEVRKLVCTFLGNAGFEILIAHDPTEASRICSEFKREIGLIVTDIVLPGISGPQLVESLIRLRPMMKALYMSGYAPDSVPSHAQLDGLATFIRKPFDAQHLIRAVREVLDKDMPGGRPPLSGRQRRRTA